jgi:hypothetical protein
MYYNLICIFYALLCGQNFILVKNGCYTIRVNEISWAHVWRLHSLYLGTGYDKWYGIEEGSLGYQQDPEDGC